MGGILSLTSCACCATTAVCSTICSMCPSGSSVLARILYSALLLLTTVISVILLAPGVETILEKFPFCEEGNPLSLGVSCADAVGYLAVYRLTFAAVMFFVTMGTLAFLTSDRPPSLQRGFWFLKYGAVFALMLVSFFLIPHGSFETVWMHFGLLGGFLFIIIQLVLIIDFADGCSKSFQIRHTESDHSGWFWALLCSTGFFFACTLMAVIFCFTYYTGLHIGDCKLHEFFISFNMILCIILSIFSVWDKIQEIDSRSGLFQASFVSMYIMFLTWSAMSNSPDLLCKSDLTDVILGNGTRHSNPDTLPAERPTMNSTSIVGLVLWFICVLYSTLTTDLSLKRSIDADVERLTEDGETPRDDNGCNWKHLHFMFSLATLYVMMTLTNWYSPRDDVDLNTLSANMLAVWVKIISAWSCFALYIWIRIAPAILTSRSFDL